MNRCSGSSCSCVAARAAGASPPSDEVLRATRMPLRLVLTAGSAVLGVWALFGAALVGVVAGTGMPPPAAAEGLACVPSVADRDEIPPALMPLYARAAREFGLGGRGVFVLAAINKVETDFGRNLGVSSAGAVGSMQFMPATWAAYGVDGDRDGRRDPNTPGDAIHAAARYLRAGGAPG